MVKVSSRYDHGDRPRINVTVNTTESGDNTDWDEMETGVHEAGAITYDNDYSGLTADDVQEAIDELAVHGHDLDDLANVDMAGKADGDLVAWNATDGEWQPVAPPSGSVPSGTDPGDLLVWDGDSWEVLPIDSDAKVLTADSGEALGVKWATPSGGAGAGGELDYAVAASDVTVTGNNEAGATTLVTGNSVSYDGSTSILVHWFCPRLSIDPAAAGTGVVVDLYEGSTILGRIAVILRQDGTADDDSVSGFYRYTPTAGSKALTVKAWRTNASNGVTAYSGAGGTGAQVRMFLRITKG